MRKTRNMNAKSVMGKRPKFDRTGFRGGLGLNRHMGKRRAKGVRG